VTNIPLPQIMLRETKRQNKAYQRHAFEVLGRYAAARTDLNLASTVLDIVAPVVQDITASEDKMDVDGTADEKLSASSRDDMISFAVTAAGQSFTALTWQGADVAKLLEAFLDLAVTANSVQGRQIAMACMTTLGTVFGAVDDGIAVRVASKEAVIVSSLEKLFFQPLYPSYGGDFKLQRAKMVFVIAGLPYGRAVLGDRLDGEIASEPSEVVRDELKKARSRLI
jgi:hypothetical protein